MNNSEKPWAVKNSNLERTGFIPENHVKDFKKAIERHSKKNQKLGSAPVHCIETGNVEIREIQHYVMNEDREMIPSVKKKHKFVEMMVVGTVAIINGWKPIAIIEHFDNSPNLITTLSNDWTSYLDPAPGYCSKFDLPSNCDHCNVYRHRRKTYILKSANPENFGEEKQVGSSCLNDFIPRYNTEQRLLHSFSWIKTVEEHFDSEQWDYLNIGHYNYYHEKEDVLRHAVYQIKRYGFVSKQKSYDTGLISTAESVKLNMDNSDIDHYVRYAKIYKNYYNQLAVDTVKYTKYLEKNASNDFEANVMAMFKSELISDKQIPYFVAGVNSFLYWIKEEDKPKDPPSNYLFQVGDKFKDHEVEVLMMKGFETRWGWSTLCLFKDNDGNKIKWFASKNTNFDVGEKIKISGKCKMHTEYNGEKQTDVSHVKVINSENYDSVIEKAI